MLEAFVPVALLLSAGVLLARLGVVAPDGQKVLHRVVIYVCLPAAILVHVPAALRESGVELWVAAVPWTLALGTLALSPLLRRIASDDARRALVVTVGLGNTSFLGYPVVRAALGDEALGPAIVFDQLGSFLLLSTFAVLVTSRERPDAASITTTILRFPPLVALVFAVLLHLTDLPVPAPLSATLGLASDAMLPLVLVALGLGLTLRLPDGQRGLLALGLSLKLALLPLLVLVALLLLGRHGPSARAALLESAMPPMVTAAVLAQDQKRAPELANAMAGVGLALSLATLPLWTWLALRFL